jgi:signal transduction histidine kinase
MSTAPTAPRPIVASVAGLPGWPRRSWLAGVVYLACAGAFVADLSYDITLAFGVLYIPLVCTAVFYRDARSVWWLTAVALAMVVVGCFFPVMNFSLATLANRILSVAAILITAALVRLAQRMRDRLALQTDHAEAADRMKTQILNNLSHELRTPLNAVIGFTELLASDCRPDQRSGLAHIGSAGHRLLATVENLLDLARLSGKALAREELDLGRLLQRASADAAGLAAAQGVQLECRIADGMTVDGNGWAVRRIASNLIGNAVKFTGSGGVVEVSTERRGGEVTAVVTDTGAGMTEAVLSRLGESFYQAEGGVGRAYEGLGTGVALCCRLADAMDAKLTFDSKPGRGTTVRLTLPAA